MGNHYHIEINSAEYGWLTVDSVGFTSRYMASKADKEQWLCVGDTRVRPCDGNKHEILTGTAANIKAALNVC